MMQFVVALLAAVFGGLGAVLLRSQQTILIDREKAAPQTAEGPAVSERLTLPPWYFTVGVIAVLVALALFVPWFYTVPMLLVVKTAAFCALLWPCAWIDAKLHLIPNRLLLIGLVVRLVILAAEIFTDAAETGYILISAGIAAGGIAVACLLCRLAVPHSVGYGDLKLLALMGLYFGMEYAWNGIFFALLILFFVSVGLLLTKRADRRSELPFAPFLFAGTVIAAFLTGI